MSIKLWNLLCLAYKNWLETSLKTKYLTQEFQGKQYELVKKKNISIRRYEQIRKIWVSDNLKRIK